MLYSVEEVHQPWLGSPWGPIIFSQNMDLLYLVFQNVCALKKRVLKASHDFLKTCTEDTLHGGRCRIRTRVDGFEARQDIQATPIALAPPRCPPLFNKAGALERPWRANYRVSQRDVLRVVGRQRCQSPKLKLPALPAEQGCKCPISLWT